MFKWLIKIEHCTHEYCGNYTSLLLSSNVDLVRIEYQGHITQLTLGQVSSGLKLNDFMHLKPAMNWALHPNRSYSRKTHQLGTLQWSLADF